MPTKIVKKGRKYNIVEPNGKVVGKSTSRKKAQASSKARNAAKHGWKPTRK